MNIYDFFNSPDVAAHCQSIGYTFNIVECAVIVYRSEKRTLKEKHEAYRAIIAEYPDIEFYTDGGEHIKSFHKALGKVIAIEERLLEKFLSTEPETVYQSEVHVFLSYEKALADALEYCDENLQKIVVDKIYLKSDSDEFNESIYVHVSSAGEIIEIGLNSLNDSDIFADFDHNASIFLYFLDIDIPVPFKAGDLVENAMGGVYVLTDIVLTDIIRGNHKVRAAYWEHGGNIECETMPFYHEFRYCRRELEGEKRILKYVSLYEQKEIDLCSLLEIQKYLLLNEKIGELKNNYRHWRRTNEIEDKLFER